MVERIKIYRFSKRFKKEYNTLPKEIQTAFDKKLTLFLEDMTHYFLEPSELTIFLPASGIKNICQAFRIFILFFAETALGEIEPSALCLSPFAFRLFPYINIPPAPSSAQ